MPSDDFNNLNASLDPIDRIENLAYQKQWNCDRLADNQIAMAVDGQWRTYSITVAKTYTQTPSLRLACTFEIDPPDDKMNQLHEALNKFNDNLWGMNIVYWEDQKLMTIKSKSDLIDDSVITDEWLDSFIQEAVHVAETFYPVIRLVLWGDYSVEEAMKVAIKEDGSQKLRPQ